MTKNEPTPSVVFYPLFVELVNARSHLFHAGASVNGNGYTRVAEDEEDDEDDWDDDEDDWDDDEDDDDWDEDDDVDDPRDDWEDDEDDWEDDEDDWDEDEERDSPEGAL